MPRPWALATASRNDDSSRSCSPTWSARRPWPKAATPELVRDLLSRYYDIARTIVGATAVRSRSSSATPSRRPGACRSPMRTMPSAPCGQPSSSSTPSRRSILARRIAPLVLRAAVMTGDVAASLGAASEGYVSGDLVNSASRLQGAADPGTVLVDDATARASDAAIAYERVPDVIVRGRSEPIPASRAVRVVAGRGGSKRTARLEAPFVGRDDESRLLKELFHATTRDHRARLVSIVGIAGIGKSRLAWELEKYIDGLVEGVYWHAGRSPAYGDGLAFWALAEMVRARAGIADGDDQTETATKLASTLDRWLTDATERAWVGSEGRRAARRSARCRRVERMSCSLPGGRCSSGCPRTARPSWCSRTSTGPKTACSTSSRSSSR